MKRTLVAVALLIACGWALIAYAFETNTGGPIDHGLICTSAETSVYFHAAKQGAMPIGYTLWSNDGTEFRYIRRFSNGVRDTIAILVPAGSSILLPAPPMIAENDSFTHTIFIGGHTDSVYAAPWFK